MNEIRVPSMTWSGLGKEIIIYENPAVAMALRAACSGF